MSGSSCLVRTASLAVFFFAVLALGFREMVPVFMGAFFACDPVDLVFLGDLLFLGIRQFQFFAQ